MPTEIYLVKAGMTMTEGTVAAWHIEDGGTVGIGALLYSMETEKITMEVDAEASGTVKHLIGPGISCDPGQVVGYIFAADEVIPDELNADALPGAVTAAANSKADGSVQPTSSNALSRIAASPIARRLAREAGIDLAAIQGTGPQGRITEADVTNYQQDSQSVADDHIPSSPAARRLARELDVNLSDIQGTGPRGRITQEDVEASANNALNQDNQYIPLSDSQGQPTPMSAMRKTIARRMHESLQNSAQLTVNMDVNMDQSVLLRTQLIAEWEADTLRPTYTDLVVRAVVKALKLHPMMNSSLTGDAIQHHDAINIGLAVALDQGLVVPVIRDSGHMNLKQLSQESRRIAAAAQAGSLTMEDYSGGTFTVSTLGMFGVDSFTPILNSPEAGILGVNRIRDGIAWRGDQPIRQKCMNLSLTWDHRIIDGAPAAQFLATIRDLLESPYRLLL